MNWGLKESYIWLGFLYYKNLFVYRDLVASQDNRTARANNGPVGTAIDAIWLAGLNNAMRLQRAKTNVAPHLGEAGLI